jgi:hypothetical protein
MSSARISLAALVCASFAQPAPARELTCPQSILPQAAYDRATWTRMEQGPAPVQARPYGGFTLYQGVPGDLVALAPDRDDGTLAVWKLDRTERYAIVCRYAGTAWTYRSPVLAGIGGCTAAARTIRCD